MKKELLLRNLFILAISLVFIITFSNVVLAEDEEDEDDSLFTSLNASNPSSTDNTSGTQNTSNTQLTTNTPALTTNSNTNTATNSNTSSINNTTTNTLAKTGISNTGSALAVVLVICGISAVYSYRKINYYKKL